MYIHVYPAGGMMMMTLCLRYESVRADILHFDLTPPPPDCTIELETL